VRDGCLDAILAGGSRVSSVDPTAARPSRTRGREVKKMRFLSLIRIDETRGQVPSEKLMSDMGRLIEEMTREGKLVATAGLRPTAEGFRVRLRRGKLSTVDLPFTEAKEVIGGYAILETGSKEEAVALTKRFLTIDGDEWDIDARSACWTGPRSAEKRRSGGAEGRCPPRREVPGPRRLTTSACGSRRPRARTTPRPSAA
jgi:hypothetical protein